MAATIAFMNPYESPKSEPSKVEFAFWFWAVLLAYAIPFMIHAVINFLPALYQQQFDIGFCRIWWFILQNHAEDPYHQMIVLGAITYPLTFYLFPFVVTCAAIRVAWAVFFD
jgi:hypothetical protein